MIQNVGKFPESKQNLLIHMSFCWNFPFYHLSNQHIRGQESNQKIGYTTRVNQVLNLYMSSTAFAKSQFTSEMQY